MKYYTSTSTSSSSIWEDDDAEISFKPPARSKNMAASESKAPVLRGLLKAGLVGGDMAILAIGTAKQLDEHFSNSSYYGVGIATRHDPLAQKNGLHPKAAAYSMVIIFYRIDDTDELMDKANMIWGGLTALYPDYIKNTKNKNKIPPQVLILSKKMNADELLNVATYAGAKSASEIKLEGIEGVCVAASIFEK